MSKLFLYIDESKDSINNKLYIVILVSNKRISLLNQHYSNLKKKFNLTGELHGFRKKEVQFFWNQLLRDAYWRKQDLVQKIYFIEFSEFHEKGFKWMQVYEHIAELFDNSNIQIYADKITLSKIDLLLIKNRLLLRGINIEFLHSGNNPSIQIADILCGFCYHEKSSEIGNIQINYSHLVLDNQ